ncbi:MAG: TIGR00266 family protein [Candidatus Promineifilaceae bacterium]|nr:TIGR00266 family protein [Candidatus Promineifilaceae bacterium]
MKVDIRYRPAFAMAMVTLEPQESIQVEGGAMVGMSAGMEMETGATGGLFKSLTRKVFGGESFFLNTYTGVKAGDSVALAPPLPGDIEVIEMQGETLMVQSGSYLASSLGIDVETKWSGAKTFFGSEGLIMLRISGSGTLIVSSYGAIHDVELADGQKYVVDTGHLVTFEEHLHFELKKVAGWKSTLFSGEGLVMELTGPGKLTVQSRSQDSFLSWLIPQIPQRSSSSN